MIDLNKLALLAAQVPMHDMDRAAMLKLIPRLSLRHLRTLLRLLEAEARAWSL